MAIALGVALAYHQRSRDAAAPPPQPSSAADERARSAAPPPTPDPADAVGGALQPPDTVARPGPADAADAVGTPDAAPPEGGPDSAPPPAPLPEFLADGLGPPPREPDGSLTEGSAHELQERLDGESRDAQWADRVEWELENYLGLQPFTERLENLDVLCRTSVCRVTAITNRAALPDAPEDGWQGMMARLGYERVSQEFDHSADVVVFKASAPDRVGFVTYFERRGR